MDDCGRWRFAHFILPRGMYDMSYVRDIVCVKATWDAPHFHTFIVEASFAEQEEMAARQKVQNARVCLYFMQLAARNRSFQAQDVSDAAKSPHSAGHRSQPSSFPPSLSSHVL